MDIHQLEYLAAVADSGSYTKAASALFVTRQALSKAIKRLEAELGFALFDLDDGRIVLTERGRRFRAEIAPTLGEFKALQSRYGSTAAKPELSIAMARGFFDVMENDFASGFFDRDAEYRVTVEQSHADGVLDMVRTGAAEVGLLGSHPQFLREFDAIALAHPGYHLLVPLSNPLCDKDRLTLADLDGQPLVTLGKKNHLHCLFTEECEREGIHPNILIETSESVLRDRYIDTDAALAFACSPKSTRPAVPTRCVPLEMRGAREFGTYAIKKHEAPLSIAGRRFWACLEEQAV